MNQITKYHAHFYYDERTVEQARVIYEKAQNLSDTFIGRFHTKPVGPHPVWSFQIGFEANQLNELIPWLTLNREELSVLIHPMTGDDLADHTTHAMWLGKELNLVLEKF